MQDSNGAGINGGPVMLETGLGDNGGAGAERTAALLHGFLADELLTGYSATI